MLYTHISRRVCVFVAVVVVVVALRWKLGRDGGCPGLTTGWNHSVPNIENVCILIVTKNRPYIEGQSGICGSGDEVN